VESEFVYSSLNLVTVIHDRILGRAGSLQTCDYKCGVEGRAVKVVKNCLTFLHYSEVLIEMVATRYSRTCCLCIRPIYCVLLRIHPIYYVLLIQIYRHHNVCVNT
jgi:hypothetical protein